MKFCLCCLSENATEDNLLCTPCEEKSSIAYIGNLTGRELIRALRAISKPYQVKEQTAKQATS
jgi:hypothetical protein